MNSDDDLLEHLQHLRWLAKDLRVELMLWRLRRKYSPDQPRVPAGNPGGGQWTSGGAALTQVAADNQRQNKIFRDVVVKLRLTPDQADQLHREISGEGLAGYHEILQRAKDMFGK